MNKVYVGNKVVGTVNGPVFYKNVSSSKHFLRRPPAIAFDITSINAARDLGATEIQVYDKDTNKLFCTDMQTLRDQGFYVNRGYGEQIALDLDNWEEVAVPF